MNFYNEITLIIVSYKSEKLISRNLEIIKKFPSVIIDNSKSKNLSTLINDFVNIKLIIPDKNLGYGQANNLGISNSKTPYILIVNPDIILNENSIKKLYLSFLENIENIGILGPSLYDSNMNRRENGSISYLKRMNGKKIFNTINNIPKGNISCEFLVGCCLFMKRDFFNQIGGFDDDFFMYFEDNDLCDRVIKNGKTVMEIPSSQFVHLENSSSKKNFFQNTKMALVHKISSYIYLKKNLNYKSFTFHIIKNFLDYFQRMIINFLLLRFNKSYKNFLRIISILLYLSNTHKFIY